MWLPPSEDPRQQGDPPRGERAVLDQYLEHFRSTLEMKCDGLAPEQLGRRAVPPSTLSLLGMMRHMARVEHHWFRRVIDDATDLPRLFDGDGEDAGFGWVGEADEALVAEAWELWRREVAHAREVLARTDLDATADVHGEQVEVRDIVVHMVEEYARHCGHVDLLRECLDGRTGV
ncbi:MAG TPA: DinB family protein [Nocardioides sp.]